MARCFVGDYVRDTVHGDRGRVKAKDLLYRGTGVIDTWFREQRPKLERGTLDQEWCAILMEGGGSTYRPEACLETVDPFGLRNRYEGRFFRPG